MKKSPRETKLNKLRLTLERAIAAGPGPRDLAALSAQYRGVLAELEEIQSQVPEADELDDIINGTGGYGQPTANPPTSPGKSLD